MQASKMQPLWVHVYDLQAPERVCKGEPDVFANSDSMALLTTHADGKPLH